MRHNLFVCTIAELWQGSQYSPAATKVSAELRSFAEALPGAPCLLMDITPQLLYLPGHWLPGLAQQASAAQGWVIHRAPEFQAILRAYSNLLPLGKLPQLCCYCK